MERLPSVIEDVRPFVAFLVPLVAVFGIVWAGEARRNLRELFTLVAGVVQAAVVLSMMPLLLEGDVVIEYQIWQIFTNDSP